MPNYSGSPGVAKSMQAIYEAITKLTDVICREHLNEEYRAMAGRMTAAPCRKRPSPLGSGQPRTWACGIVYVIGQINFLTDPSTQPFMTTADLCARFGVDQSTASAKARVITQVLDTKSFSDHASLQQRARRVRPRDVGWCADEQGGLAPKLTAGQTAKWGRRP